MGSEIVKHILATEQQQNHWSASTLNVLNLGNRLLLVISGCKHFFLDRHYPFLQSCQEKRNGTFIHCYLFLKFQFVVISLNTPTQIYSIRIVRLKLTEALIITEPEISVSFLLSVRIIKVNNKYNIMKNDENN